MSALQIVAIILGVGITIVGWGLLARAVKHFVTVFKLGASTPAKERTGQPGARTATLLREFLGHTRMSRLPIVAIAHWVTMISFGVLFLTLVQATFQLFDPHFVLPLIGHFFVYEWITELFAMTGIVTIVMLMVIRQRSHPRSAAGDEGRKSRFFGSTFWQAYYVELTILGVGICIALLRGLERALLLNTGETDNASLLHFPLTGWLGSLFSGMSVGALEAGIVVVALIKLLISYAWMITISINPTMGVAWHRFLAFFNIYFKRHADGRTSLGELQPMLVDGKPFSMEVMEEMEEDSTLGVGKVEDFTWKGLLDFSTCTECGRCQSQCPAWNTEKPLSPKLLMMTLRDHAHAKAPYLAAAQGVSGVYTPASAAKGQTADGAVAFGGAEAVQAEGAVATAEPDAINWGEMSLVGQTGYDIDHPLSAYNPHGPDAVIDEDVLWSCTTCGACVEQCPVDIEHVDHIVDMRRYQNLIESAFPSELGGLFKKLESKGNPWGMGAKARMDWAKDLPFTVKVLGEDVESADDVDYLFWVGCAGAYEDRAKKTTRAVAELFDHAGVDFAVLGNGETCTGDSARRAGNEVLFQMLAEQNVETLNELGATKIVVTCAHCFNTIKNEYPQLGGKYEVLHHTQLLNRLVREKKIVPVNRPEGPRKSSLKDVASSAPSVTYHDPCYLGRHNNVYAPPRELISALPGVELKEMERTKEKSFCCGAGGARMWMEEQLGSRINLNRTEEAIATGADRIAVGCPFCRVMLSDGLTAKQSEGASEDIEVVDVAQMLLASVKEAVVPAKGGTTEAQEQTEAEPKTAVPAPTEGEGAKGATPAAPSEAETAQTAAAVEEAGEDPQAVAGRETAADKNAAPSWETGAAVGAGGAAAGAGAAATDSSPADKNAAPSWETGSAAEKNAAPSWETGTPAAAPAAEEPKAEATAADKNAAPSWETGAPTAAPAAEAPKAETDTATAPAADDSVAAKNAAPSWETGAAAPAAEAPKAETDTATAPAADDSVAAKNAAPSWETGAAAPAPAAEAPTTTEAASEAEAEATPAEESAPQAEAEQAAPAAAATPAAAPTGDSDLAAKNAAPSWETGTAAPAAAPAAAAPAEESAAEAEDEAAPAEESTPQPEAEQAAPAAAPTDDTDLAAKNAAPSWETGAAAPAPVAEAPTTTEAPAEAEDEGPGAEATPAEEAAPQPEAEEAPAAEVEDEAPAAEEAAPTAATEAPAASADDSNLSELAKKNANPS
ncbi:(Fe-S)-binding protein, partial [Janibacter hoylei]|uniref:(Fe-S)-binding protein n=1 Tax=Janibacter hoylei TaxID=364298 RepID=UPI002883428F